MSRIVIASILILVAGYGLTKGWPLLRGPSIEIMRAEVGVSSTTPSSILTLSGVASHTQTLTLNGGVLLIDSVGQFNTVLTLPSGGGILYLTATDRFGRRATIERMVMIP